MAEAAVESSAVAFAPVLRIAKRRPPAVPFPCLVPGCTFVGSRRSSLITHTRTHTGVKPFVCSTLGCTYAAATRGALRIHLRTHTGERPYVCKVQGCGYSSAVGTHLILCATHQRAHTGERPYRCHVEGCAYATTDKSSLKGHLEAHERGFKTVRCYFNTNIGRQGGGCAGQGE